MGERFNPHYELEIHKFFTLKIEVRLNASLQFLVSPGIGFNLICLPIAKQIRN